MSQHTHESGHHHVSTMKMLNGILIVLLILTTATVVVSRFDFGSLNLAIAVSIAVVKASLVCAFFMHLLHDKALNSVIIFYTIIGIFTFIGFTMIDMGSRDAVEAIRAENTQKPPLVGEVLIQAAEEHADEGAPAGDH